MIERSLFESIGDSRDIIVSGKGGVGKSTMSAALINFFSNQALSTIGIDMDKAHSLGDSFGLDIDENEKFTFSLDINANLKLYFLSQIIPDIYDDNESHDNLNQYLDNLVDIEKSFIPLLRLALHSSFSGMSQPHENTAYVLQLLELFRKNTIYKIDDKRSEKEVLDSNFDRRIIDSENTRGLIRVIKSILDIQKTLRNLNKTFYGNSIEKAKQLKTRVAINGQANLLALTKSDIIRNYKNYIGDVVGFHQQMTKASVVIVTQPGYNDLNQAIKEMKLLKEIGFIPRHVLVNKFRDQFNKDPETTIKMYNMLSDLFEGDDIGISKVDSEFILLNPELSEKEKIEIAKVNLGNIAKTFI